jgi:signal recognition particle receptor subunit beta
VFRYSDNSDRQVDPAHARGALAPALGAAAPIRPPMPVKIVVSGGFGVGKTTFIGSLSEIEPLTTEAAMTSAAIDIDQLGAGQEKTTTTVAMDFGRVTIDSSIILYMFGTPGQDRFGFMWNDLANGALGGVVLVDTHRVADSFVAMDYFEKIGLPYVVAINQFEGQQNLPLEQVRAAVNVDPQVPVVAVDARSREPVKQVILTLLYVVLDHARSAAG